MSLLELLVGVAALLLLFSAMAAVADHRPDREADGTTREMEP